MLISPPSTAQGIEAGTLSRPHVEPLHEADGWSAGWLLASQFRVSFSFLAAAYVGVRRGEHMTMLPATGRRDFTFASKHYQAGRFIGSNMSSMVHLVLSRRIYPHVRV